MIIELPPQWLARWQHPDPFWHVLHLQGKIFREQPGRKTLRFTLEDENYFVKMHFGVGWREIIKNLSQGRLPVLGAKNEYIAIRRLEHFGFTPTIVGYGLRGKNPATQQSFIITKELDCTISLEDFCRDWPTVAPDSALKAALIKKIALIAKNIHDQGINHRDFYLCHFLLDLTGGRDLLDPDALNLYVIDWHRAQTRAKIPLRWRIKDIAGLYFSAMDIGLSPEDLQLFMYHYDSQMSQHFWWQVKRRAHKLYRKIHHYSPKGA